MKNNLIPSILDSLDESIKECKKTIVFNPDLFTPNAMLGCYQRTKEKIFDLSATNLGERILHLKGNHKELHQLFIDGKVTLTTAEVLIKHYP